MLSRRQALVALTAVPIVAATTTASAEPERPAECCSRPAESEPSNGACFRVVKIDPEGSGMDWQGHLGQLVRNAKRCCENCTIIIGDLGHPDNKWEAAFCHGELEPLNGAAEDVLGSVYQFLSARRYPLVDVGNIPPSEQAEYIERVRAQYIRSVRERARV